MPSRWSLPTTTTWPWGPSTPAGRRDSPSSDVCSSDLVDATPPALEAVAAGTLQGTVQNDAAGQAERILAICCAVMDGEDPGTTLDLTDGKYAWLEYTTVTAENLADFLPEG